ncbi:MAG: hypothetical protein HKN22_05495, partial [Bacteroidia bacterium]|nr:hypothetical protein [Bacteroidia bacterium]
GLGFVKSISLRKVEKEKRSKKKKGRSRIGTLTYSLLYFAFFYLTLKSYRNIPFFLIVGFPAFVYGLSSVTIKLRTIKTTTALQLFNVLAILFFILLVSNVFYEKTGIKNRYGLEIDATRTPVGAANFLIENNIGGKSYTDFIVSSYLLWRLQPTYKTFIDLRDLDIFPAEFFRNNMLIYQQPQTLVQGGKTLWDLIVAEDDYNFIVLTNKPNIQGLQRHLVNNDNRYELVFADNVCSVYLKNSEENSELIRKFGLSEGNDVYHLLKPIKTSKFAMTINRIFNPFYDPKNNLTDTDRRISYYNYIDKSNPVQREDPSSF